MSRPDGDLLSHRLGLPEFLFIQIDGLGADMLEAAMVSDHARFLRSRVDNGSHRLVPIYVISTPLILSGNGQTQGAPFRGASGRHSTNSCADSPARPRSPPGPAEPLVGDESVHRLFKRWLDEVQSTPDGE